MARAEDISRTRYKYEYRTGPSRHHNYNYNVSGTDADGNSVSGNVDMHGKYGSGMVIDADGGEKSVEVEWTGYGELEATDEDGNVYEMEAE